MSENYNALKESTKSILQRIKHEDVARKTLLTDKFQARLYAQSVLQKNIYGKDSNGTPLSEVFEDQKSATDFLIPLIGVWKAPWDINFDILPLPCILKTNHGCGYNITIRTDIDTDRIKKYRAQLSEWLTIDYSWFNNEPQYLNIQRCIVGENYYNDLRLCQVFCFNGVPTYIATPVGKWNIEDKILHSYQAVHDINFNLIRGAKICHFEPHLEIIPANTPLLARRLTLLSEWLSKDLPFVRMDYLVSNNGKIYFNEFTFSPGAMWLELSPVEFEDEFIEHLTTTLSNEH